MKVGAGDLVTVTVVQVPFYLSQVRLGTLLLQTVLHGAGTVSKCAIAERNEMTALSHA